MITRDELVTNYTARPIVKFFLLFQDNPRALIFFISLILACVIVTILLYIINVTYITISVLKSNADWKVIVNTFVATVIVITNFIVVKYFKVDDYIRGGILDSLFVARSEAIKTKRIQDVGQSPVTQAAVPKKLPGKPVCTMIVLGKTVMESSLIQNDSESVMKDYQRSFTFEMVTYPFFYAKKEKAREDREHTEIKPLNVKDAVYVFYGKYATVESKLYRFAVSQLSADALWKYLIKVTMHDPEEKESPMKLWRDDAPLELQEQQIESSIPKSMESGFGSINDEQKLYASEFSLFLDPNNIWQCKKKDHEEAQHAYIYFMTKKFSSLKDVADKFMSNCERYCSINIERLLKGAKYIKKLHDRNIVHGNITMRNIQLIPYTVGFDTEEDIFISTECFFFHPEQLDPNTEEGRKRRKFFDADQREDPTNVSKATDVFAFGLCIVELLCKFEKQGLITKSIRSHEVMKTLRKNEFTKDCCLLLDGFGSLLEEMFKPRPERATIDRVVQFLEKMK